MLLCLYAVQQALLVRKRLLKVCYQIADVLDSDRIPDEAVGNCVTPLAADFAFPAELDLAYEELAVRDGSTVMETWPEFG